jgi:hypothetical protein
MRLGNIEAEKVDSDYELEKKAIAEVLEQKRLELLISKEQRKAVLIEKVKSHLLKGGMLRITPEMEELQIVDELKTFALQVSMRRDMFTQLGYFEKD